MGYQSKTYSLSDEVVAAIETARRERGETPNQLLRRVLLGPGAVVLKGTPRITDETTDPEPNHLRYEADE